MSTGIFSSKSPDAKVPIVYWLSAAGVAVSVAGYFGIRSAVKFNRKCKARNYTNKLISSDHIYVREEIDKQKANAADIERKLRAYQAQTDSIFTHISEVRAKTQHEVAVLEAHAQKQVEALQAELQHKNSMTDHCEQQLRDLEREKYKTTTELNVLKECEKAYIDELKEAAVATAAQRLEEEIANAKRTSSAQLQQELSAIENGNRKVQDW